MREAPVNWTANPQYYETFVERPEAENCAYWGAVEIAGHCEAALAFGSSPKKLRCKVDTKFDHIVHCTWAKPVAPKKGELGR
jgi:hypothetical protein